VIRKSPEIQLWQDSHLDICRTVADFEVKVRFIRISCG